MLLLPWRRHAAPGRAGAAVRRAHRVPRGGLAVRGAARRDPPDRAASAPAPTARARGPTGWRTCGSSRAAVPPARRRAPVALDGALVCRTGRPAAGGRRRRPRPAPGLRAALVPRRRARSRGRYASRGGSGRCLAPCRGEAERAAHAAAAARGGTAREGGAAPVGRLRARRAALAADQRFEEAARLRDAEAALRRPAPGCGASGRAGAARRRAGPHRDPRLVQAFAVAYGLVVERRPLPRAGDAAPRAVGARRDGRARRPRRARPGGAARGAGRSPRRGAARGRRVLAGGELPRRRRRRRRTARGRGRRGARARLTARVRRLHCDRCASQPTLPTAWQRGSKRSPRCSASASTPGRRFPTSVTAASATTAPAWPGRWSGTASAWSRRSRRAPPR